MKKKIRWGLVSAGHISEVFATDLQSSQTGVVSAVASRTLEKAEFFCERFAAGAKAYGNYEEMLKSDDVDAVYISTPHPMHKKWAIEAARQKKHILCEKPMALNAEDAREIIEVAKRQDVFLMEAFMYRCHPQTEKLVELLRDEVLGEVRAIQGTFCFEAKFDPNHRTFAKKLGGGGILDVGCYPVSISRLIAGVALKKAEGYANPVELRGVAAIRERAGVDEWASAVLKFEGDILAEVACGIGLQREWGVHIIGTQGRLHVPSPFKCFEKSVLILEKNGKTEEIVVKADKPLYAYEADIVAKHIGDRQAVFPAMSWGDTMGNMQALDAWRTDAGMKYPGEGD